MLCFYTFLWLWCSVTPVEKHKTLHWHRGRVDVFLCLRASLKVVQFTHHCLKVCFSVVSLQNTQRPRQQRLQIQAGWSAACSGGRSDVICVTKHGQLCRHIEHECDEIVPASSKIWREDWATGKCNAGLESLQMTTTEGCLGLTLKWRPWKTEVRRAFYTSQGELRAPWKTCPTQSLGC